MIHLCVVFFLFFRSLLVWDVNWSPLVKFACAFQTETRLEKAMALLNFCFIFSPAEIGEIIIPNRLSKLSQSRTSTGFSASGASKQPRPPRSLIDNNPSPIVVCEVSFNKFSNSCTCMFLSTHWIYKPSSRPGFWSMCDPVVFPSAKPLDCPLSSLWTTLPIDIKSPARSDDVRVMLDWASVRWVFVFFISSSLLFFPSLLFPCDARYPSQCYRRVACNNLITVQKTSLLKSPLPWNSQNKFKRGCSQSKLIIKSADPKDNVIKTSAKSQD